MDWSVTLETLLATFGAIAIFGAGISWITKLLDPFKELKKVVEGHSEMLGNDKGKLDNIEHSLERLEQQNGVIYATMLEMLNHMITGNDISRLEEHRDEIIDQLTKKKGKATHV